MKGWKVLTNHIDIGKKINNDSKLKAYRYKLLKDGKHIRIIATYGGWLIRKPFCDVLKEKRQKEKNVKIEVITDSKPIGGSSLVEWKKCHEFMKNIGCKIYIRFFPKLKLNMLISDHNSAVFFERDKFTQKMIGARFIEKEYDTSDYIKKLINDFDKEKKFDNIIRQIFYIIRNKAYEKKIDIIAFLICILITSLFHNPLGAIISIISLFIAVIFWTFIEMKKNGIF